MARPTRLTRAHPRPDAGGVDYDNTTSGLTADTLQEAIDELAATAGGISVDDGTTTVDPTTTLTFDPDFFDVTAPGGDVAEVTFVGEMGIGATAFIGARVHNSGSVALTNGVDTLITFDSERYDTDGIHSTSSNTGRLTVPAGMSGKWHVGGSVRVTGSPNVSSYVAIRRVQSGGGGGTFVAIQAIPNDANLPVASLSADFDMAAGDYFEMIVLVNAGSKNATANTSYSPEFWCHKLDSGKAGTAIGAQAYNNAVQSVATGTQTALTLNTEDWDSDGYHSTSANTSRMTIPAGLGGKYLILGRSFVPFTKASTSYLSILLNGSSTPVRRIGADLTALVDTVDIVVTLDLVAGDYVELAYEHDNGSSQNVGHASARRVQTTFSIMRLDSGSGSSLVQRGQAKRTAGNLSITSTTFATATGMSVSLTTGAHRCLVIVNANGIGPGSTDFLAIDVAVDGTRLGEGAGLAVLIGSAGAGMSFTVETGVLSAASHTFTLEARVSNGTGTLFAGTASSLPLILTVIETGLGV